MPIPMAKVLMDYFPLVGGLDQITPPLSVPPGRARSSVNFEASPNGGYTRIAGYERLDGRSKPSLAIYHILPVSLTGAVSEGGTVTGATASGVVVKNMTSYLVLTKVSGTFVKNETISVSAAPVGTATDSNYANGAATSQLAAEYANLAADSYRSDIYEVGKNNVTITVATPAVITWVGHGLSVNAPIKFATSGALPTGITAGTTYYVKTVVSDDTFQISATQGGAAINTTGTQSGTHTCLAGEGQVLGVWVYQGVTYAFRNNIGSSGALMWKSSSTGWKGIRLPSKATFGTAPQAIPDGTAVTGNTSGAVATVRRTALRTGSHTANPPTATGDLFMDIVSGTFNGTEVLRKTTGSTVAISNASPGVVTWNSHGLAVDTPVVFNTTGGLPTGLTAGTVYYVKTVNDTNNFTVAATRGGTAINTSSVGSGTHTGYVAYLSLTSTTSVVTLGANGRYEFVNNNFGGSVVSQRMYGCDGINKAFEFDGTAFVQITTGMTNDAPNHIMAHKNYLWLSFGSSVQFSSVGTPYAWSPVTGAGEIAAGDTVTNFLVMPGSDGSSALAITTTNQTLVLYGSSSGTFTLATFSYDTGAKPYSGQLIGQAYFLDDRGLINMQASQVYGNFQQATVSQSCQTFINEHISRAMGSTVSRSRNQYRLFFTDKYGLYVTIFNGQVVGLMPVLFDVVPACLCNQEWSDGGEAALMGATNGYIYELDKGSSFDGNNINATMSLVFNHVKSPRLRKRYRKAVFEVTGTGYGSFIVGWDLGYATTDAFQGDSVSTALTSGYWDQGITWDQFYFDGLDLMPAEAEITGTGENISMKLTTDSDQYQPFTIAGVLLHYTPRRQLR